jgi:hypothetical protein
MYIGHVRYQSLLSDFKEIWIFSTYFRKIHKYKISWKSVQWEPSCSVRTEDGHTDMTKLIVAFRNVANAPQPGDVFSVITKINSHYFPIEHWFDWSLQWWHTVFFLWGANWCFRYNLILVFNGLISVELQRTFMALHSWISCTHANTYIPYHKRRAYYVRCLLHSWNIQ